MPVAILHPYSEFLFHIHLDGHAVHIETQGEHDVLPQHSMIPGGKIDMGIMNSMTDVERSGRISWRIIDGIGYLCTVYIELVYFLRLPPILPLLLYLFQIKFGHFLPLI